MSRIQLNDEIVIERPVFSPPNKIPAPPQRETFIYGARESDFTTVTFILTRENGDSIRDNLMIGIDEHNGEPATRLTIRGQFEANEIPGHLRWLADSIAQQVEERSYAVAEYVTCHKLRGGGK
jgi:hypothetical protein